MKRWPFSRSFSKGSQNFWQGREVELNLLIGFCGLTLFSAEMNGGEISTAELGRPQR